MGEASGARIKPTRRVTTRRVIAARPARAPRFWLVALALVFTGLLTAAPADGLISPVTLIDGPSSEITALGGVAMAADGTGGIVYLKRVEETVAERVEGQTRETVVHRVHVFAAQYANDRWYPPQRVDVGQQFDSSFPAIAAGEGGRLVVVWVNHYSRNTDGLFSAALEPGSSGFQSPVPIDLNIGEATGTYPSVAMDGAGAAYVVYRVVNAVSGPSRPEIPHGYVLSEIRMAHFDGEYWTSLGAPINRNPAQAMEAPTAANSPRVAIDVTGQGLVAWQEPDDSFINRIYARRLFGTVAGDILPVSPPTFDGHPLNGAAAELALDVGGFGEGAVAFLQEPAPGSGFTRPQVFVNEIPTTFDPKGQYFGTARLADGGGEGPLGPIGPLSVAVDGKGAFDVGFGSGDESLEMPGSETSVGEPVRLDDGASTVAGNPMLTRAEDGALAAAWSVEEHGAGAVAVLERRADGTSSRVLVSGPSGGAVGALDLAGSHRGDALIGFLQGEGASTQVVALAVRAPPGEFVAEAPQTWTSAASIPIAWERPLAGAGELTYSVLVDDQQVAEGITVPDYTLTPSEVPNGVHTVQIEATDAVGQVVDSSPATLKVERTPPKIVVSSRGLSVDIRVLDLPSGESPGVAHGSVRVSFGDGHSARGRVRISHRYARPGVYTVAVTAADKAGNKRTVRVRERVT